MIHRFVNVGDIVSFSLFDVTVQAVVADVDLAVWEPLVQRLLGVINELE